MDAAEVIRHCEDILKGAKVTTAPVQASNFLDYAELTKDVILDWPKAKRDDAYWLTDFAEWPGCCLWPADLAGRGQGGRCFWSPEFAGGRSWLRARPRAGPRTFRQAGF